MVEQAVGYALTEVEEGEEHDLTMPESADVAEAIAARGAFEDSVMVGDGVLVRTDGKIERNKTAFMVRPGKYGFLPGFRWEEQNNVPLCDCENLLMRVGSQGKCNNGRFNAIFGEVSATRFSRVSFLSDCMRKKFCI